MASTGNRLLAGALGLVQRGGAAANRLKQVATSPTPATPADAVAGPAREAEDGAGLSEGPARKRKRIQVGPATELDGVVSRGRGLAKAAEPSESRVEAASEVVGCVRGAWTAGRRANVARRALDPVLKHASQASGCPSAGGCAARHHTAQRGRRGQSVCRGSRDAAGAAQ